MPIHLSGKNGENILIQPQAVSGDERTLLEALAGTGHIYRIGQLVEWHNKLGSHPRFEEKRKKTTTRKMYQIIRNLRDAGYPIVGDHRGVWLATTVSEVETFAAWLERKGRADVRSMLSLRKQMLHMVQSTAPSLFDPIADKIYEPDQAA